MGQCLTLTERLFEETREQLLEAQRQPHATLLRLASHSPAEEFGELAHRNASYVWPRKTGCMDGRVLPNEPKIGLPGAFYFGTSTEKMHLVRKIERVNPRSIDEIICHADCGAKKAKERRHFRKSGGVFLSPAAHEESVERLRRLFRSHPVVRHAGYSETDDYRMAGAHGIHDEVGVVVDGTGSYFVRSLGIDAQIFTVSERYFPNGDKGNHIHSQKAVRLAQFIALGPSGLNRYFTEHNPFVILIVENPAIKGCSAKEIRKRINLDGWIDHKRSIVITITAA